MYWGSEDWTQTNCESKGPHFWECLEVSLTGKLQLTLPSRD
jgi:hypothetical protein